MSYTIQNLQDDLEPILHGFSVNKLSNFYNQCRRAGNKVMSMVDLHTTERVVPMTNALYDSIYDYVVPDDLKLNKIFDIAPQMSRSRYDSNGQINSRQFDIKRSLNTFAIKNNSGVKTLRINKKLYDPYVVHTCDSLTSDGTWVASTDANTLTLDTNYYLSGSGSLKFNLDGLTGTGVLTLTSANAKNLSSVKDAGALFTWLYFTDETRITNVKLRWGSSASDYYTRTVTTPHTETAFKKYWNLLRFDWNGATQVGTPDDDAITYARVEITYTVGTAMSGLYLENIIAVRGVPYEIHYYSGYMFKSSAGVYKEIPTDITDIICVDNDSYAIFLDELALICAQSNQSEESAFDTAHFNAELHGVRGMRAGLYANYKMSYPSKALIQIDEYYDMGYDDKIDKEWDEPSWIV